MRPGAWRTTFVDISPGRDTPTGGRGQSNSRSAALVLHRRSMTKTKATDSPTKSRRDIYQEITEAILASLEAGVVPWHQPWSGGQLPTSMSTNKPYRGINAFLLGLSPYASPWWGTYRQIQEFGGQVRKGERATQVVFWKRLTVGTTAEERAAGRGNTKQIPLLRHFSVFNAEQCDGLPTRYAAAEPRAIDFDPIAEAEAIISGYPSPPKIHHRGDRAYYVPRLDEIVIPPSSAFESAHDYYSTIFHEASHSTGHASRLARPTLLESHHFGDPNYSREELVAEMGAAMLSGVAGIAHRTVPQNAAYIGSWLKVLRGDPKMVIQAAAQAQKVCDLILGTTFPDMTEEA